MDLLKALSLVVMAPTINDMIRVRMVDDALMSVHYPEAMGNTANIAYGGCALGMAVNAGVCSVPSDYFLYAAHGLFLGPCLTSEKLSFAIFRVRETKSFRTIRVEARQFQKGKPRVTFYITLDFQVKEQTALKFNLSPRIQHPGPESCLPLEDFMQEAALKGIFPKKLVQVWLTSFEMSRRFFEMRQCPESVSAQNLSGMFKPAKTTQDGMHITQKSSAYWFRSRSPISKQESYAAIAFKTDAALAFVAVTFRNEFITDYGALSTLDCVLRFHTSDFTCNEWMLHEQVTECGNEGRTYSTGRVFKENGDLVATMTQASILRPKTVNVSTANL